MRSLLNVQRPHTSNCFVSGSKYPVPFVLQCNRSSLCLNMACRLVLILRNCQVCLMRTESFWKEEGQVSLLVQSRSMGMLRWDSAGWMPCSESTLKIAFFPPPMFQIKAWAKMFFFFNLCLFPCLTWLACVCPSVALWGITDWIQDLWRQQLYTFSPALLRHASPHPSRVPDAAGPWADGSPASQMLSRTAWQQLKCVH